jgi:hypothetical protein
MRRRRGWLPQPFGMGLVLLAAGVLSACAGLEVKDASGAADDTVEGIRYYESSPYLLVHTDNAGGLTTRIVHLPDRTKKRSIRPYATLASGEGTFEFRNGVLTGMQSDGDAGVIPRAIAGALETAAKAAIAAGRGSDLESDAPSTVPAPYLFKIVVRGDHVELIGGGRPEPIRVDVPKEK